MADRNRTHTTHTRYNTQQGDFDLLGELYAEGTYKNSETAPTKWFSVVIMDVEFTWFCELNVCEYCGEHVMTKPNDCMVCLDWKIGSGKFPLEEEE